MWRSERLLDKPAVRGARGLCPACGQGHMFGKFLKVNHHCALCGEELHHHQADDFPAYLVIVIVGHFVVGLTLFVEAAFAPPLWINAAIFVPLTVLLAIMLIQPVKGFVVAWQWQVGMDGFAAAKTAREVAKRAVDVSALCRAG